MSLLAILLVAAGIACVVLGYQRARGPWARYRALREQDANVERYQQWRGGVRGDSSTTGASVAMQILRRQAQVGMAIVALGVVLMFLGFFIK